MLRGQVLQSELKKRMNLSLRASSPIWASGPLARAFSRGSLRLPR